MNTEDDDPARALFDSHPDLLDPEWRRKAEKAARKQRKARDDYWRAETGSTRPPRRPRRWVLPVVIVALVGGAVTWMGLDDAKHGGGAQALSATPPSVTATTRVVAAFDINQPFANTPAAGWGDAAAGIVPPVAAPVGAYTAAQVADAYQRVKQVLSSAHLDNQMLINHDPSAYLAPFAPKARAEEQQGLASPQNVSNDGRVTQLAGGYTLLPAPIKVDGTMSAAVDSDGNLAVHTNYVFAYPFRPVSAALITVSWEIVAIVHTQETFHLINDTHRYADDSQGLWPGETQSYFSQMACGPAKTGYLAPAYTDTDVMAPESENPDALYDPNHTMNIQDGCPQ